MIHGLNSHTDGANLTRSTAYMRDLGVTSARDTITWASVEQVAGTFAFQPTARAKLSLLESVGRENAIPLCYGNAAHGINAPMTQADRDRFIEYVRWIVPQTRHTVKYYEIWNEWNGGMGFTPAQSARPQAERIAAYTALCRDVYPVIKELAPDSVVLGLVISWLDQAYIQESVNSGLLSHCDAVAIHCYNDAGGEIARPEHAVARMDYTQGILSAAKGGSPVDCYVTEQGWANYTSAQYDASRIAGYLTRYYNLCERRPWVKGVWWYGLYDNGVDGASMFNRYGLVTQNGLAPKPNYHAYRAFINRGKREEWGWVEVGVTAAIETRINSRNPIIPERVMRGLMNLRSTGTTKDVGGVTLRLMRGPVLLSVLDEIGERLGADFEITQGPVYKGVTPAQTSVTRDTTWPNGWP